MIDPLPNSAGAVFADGAIQGTAHDRTRHFLTHLTIPPFGVMVMKPEVRTPLAEIARRLQPQDAGAAALRKVSTLRFGGRLSTRCLAVTPVQMIHPPFQDTGKRRAP